ncbi:MAG: dihydroorotase [Ignavibacteria bacterium]|nr:dihydroorotase [Ignavibacteria bacterium]
MHILLKNIFVLSPKDNLKGVFDVYIADGIISKIGVIDESSLPVDINIFDCEGKTLMPGFFDMHVHFRDPGQTEKEDIISGCESAANGGFTGVLCMPNTNPPIDEPETIRYIIEKAKDNIVDVFVSACASKLRKDAEPANFQILFDEGAAAFTDDGSPVSNPEILKSVLEFSAVNGTPFMQHAENIKLSANGAIHKGKVSEQLQVEGISEDSEIVTVKNDISLADSIKYSRYHVQHISCGETVDIVREARKNNKYITAEACPHHFILTDENVLVNGPNAKMNPPLRSDKDVNKIIQGLQDDTIEVLCTDHAPHTALEKSKGLSKAPFGIVGLETCIGLSYKYLVDEDIISVDKWIEKLSDNPRRLLNLPRIQIAEGEKANFTIVDFDAEWTIDSGKFKSKGKNTPFDGFQTACKPFAIINNGKIYFSDL